MEKPDEWDVLRLRALQVVTQVLSGTSFKCRVGQVVEEDEVCQMLNLLIEAAILTIQEYGTISAPMPAKLKKNHTLLFFPGLLDLVGTRDHWYSTSFSTLYSKALCLPEC